MPEICDNILLLSMGNYSLSHEMKPCYEGLKEIGVDVNEI